MFLRIIRSCCLLVPSRSLVTYDGYLGIHFSVEFAFSEPISQLKGCLTLFQTKLYGNRNKIELLA